MDNDLQASGNYTEEKIIINVVWANVFSLIVMFIAIVVLGVPFILLWADSFSGGISWEIIPSNGIWYMPLFNILICIVILIIGIVLHEAIHGIFFAMHAKNKFKSIKFGIMPKEKLFTPYCHCKETLKINHYRIAAIMPTIILGAVPSAISLIIGNFVLLFWSILFICAGCGDMLMLMKTAKEKSSALIYDLPDDLGFIIYRPKN